MATAMSLKDTETYAVTALLITLPTLYSLVRRKPHSDRPRPPLRTALSLLVLGHTLYILHELLLGPPPNLFRQFRIPLTLSIDGVRAILMARAGEAYATAPATDALLTRLASFDMRTLYVRCAHPRVLLSEGI
jgi:hypothetical protein